MRRAIECLLVVGSAPIWLPVALAVAALVRVVIGSPVLFTQRRPGAGGKIFRIVKFRTMSDARSADGRLLPDAERLGAFGRWLRSTSLDELPELWNVLLGEMSLVGPRPLREEYLDRYDEVQARRHEVPPGITGWAQINGRNSIDWEERLAMDVWYVDHRSLWLDAKILARTVAKVIRRDGISSDSHVTMPEFKGTMRHEH